MDAKIEILHKLQAMASELGRVPKRDEFTAAHFTRNYVENHWGSWSILLQAAGLGGTPGVRQGPVINEFPELKKPPKIMYLDIETAPIEARVWGRWEQNVAMNQITRDWFVLAFAAEINGVMHYLDQRYAKPIEDDSMLIMAIHHLLNEADVVYTWNGDRFDLKKLNARFFKHKLPPPTSYRSIDGLKIAKNKFSLTSNKLDDVSKLLGVEGKLHSEKFPGQELWNHCLAGNMEAWEAMASYNQRDVLILKEVMKCIDPWHNKVNFSMFEHENKCSCGSREFNEAPIKTTNSGKFKRFVCANCGKEFQRKTNLIHPETRKELMK